MKAKIAEQVAKLISLDRTIAKLYKGKVFYRPDLRDGELPMVKMFALQKNAVSVSGCATVEAFEAVGQEPDAAPEKHKCPNCGSDEILPIGHGGLLCRRCDKTNPAPADVPEKLTMKDVPNNDPKSKSELNKAAADIMVTAFSLCKEAVPLLSSLVWRIHCFEEHEAKMVDECDRAYCNQVKEFFAKLDTELFHDTMADEMEDVIGVKPTVGGAE